MGPIDFRPIYAILVQDDNVRLNRFFYLDRY